MNKYWKHKNSPYILMVMKYINPYICKSSHSMLRISAFRLDIFQTYQIIFWNPANVNRSDGSISFSSRFPDNMNIYQAEPTQHKTLLLRLDKVLNVLILSDSKLLSNH